MAVISRKELPAIRERHRDQKIIFCSGCFDLTHVGHLVFFECCKALGDILVVMVGCDALIKDYKGQDRPIVNEKARLKMVDALKPVDYSFLESPARTSESDPLLTHHEMLLTLDPIFSELNPDYYCVNDDAFEIEFRKLMLARHRTKLVVMDRMNELLPEQCRFNEMSTSYLVEKIKRMAPQSLILPKNKYSSRLPQKTP